MPRSRRRPSRVAAAARLSDVALPSLEPVTAPGPAHTVVVRGARVSVRGAPVGAAPATADLEPALLVHGLGGSALNWTDFAALISSRTAVEAIDLPGFGRSGPPAGNDYSLANQARTVIAYLERSRRGPTHLVANSMGGAISILVAARRPDLVRSLTLISPAVPDIRVRAHPLRTDWRMGLLVVPYVGTVAMRRLGRVAIEQRARATVALCFAKPTRFPARRLAEAVGEAMARDALPWRDTAMLRSTRALARTQFVENRSGWALLRAISAPTLVVWGDADRLVAPDLAPFVAAAIDDSRLLVLDDIGHTAMMEDPQTCARAFLALLEDVELPTKR